MMSWLIVIVIFATSPSHIHCLLNLTINAPNECPELTLTCHAVGLTSFLAWYLNSDLLAIHNYIDMNMSLYPLTLEPNNATLDALAGGVGILILEEGLNENNADQIDFLSTMTVNISALQLAGITNISCGSRVITTTVSLTPRIPRNVTIWYEIYNVNLQLRSVSVKWNRVAQRNHCLHMVTYTVILNDNLGMKVDEMQISSDSCNNATCSTTFFFSPTNLSYRVSVRATNIFGSSASSVSNYTICNTIPKPPTNLHVREVQLVNTSFSHVTVILCWNAPMEDVTISYLVNITEIMNGFSRQMSSNNTSLRTKINISAEYLFRVVTVSCAGISNAQSILFKITDYHQQLTFPTVKEWHIGVSCSVVVIVQITCTAACVSALMALKKKKAQNSTVEVSYKLAEHVQSERSGQEGPQYEDILPQEKASIKLKDNVAYCTNTHKL